MLVSVEGMKLMTPIQKLSRWEEVTNRKEEDPIVSSTFELIRKDYEKIDRNNWGSYIQVLFVARSVCIQDTSAMALYAASKLVEEKAAR